MAVATALGLALAGCGGGGDGGAPPPPATTTTLVLTSANQDSVAHSTAAGILPMSPVQTLPLAALSASSRNAALGMAAGHRPGWLNHVIAAVRQPERVKGMWVGASRVRPLAVVGPLEEPCYYAGSFSTTFDDRDGNGDISPNDVLTLTFNACMDTPDETVDGTVVTTITEINADVMRARMTMTNLSDSTARHGTKMTGSMQFYYEMLSSTTDITRLTAEGSVVAEVDIFHLPFKDTVTLKSGFVEELTYDAGMSTLTVSGGFDSAVAGGSVEVFTRTAVPILKADGASYPNAGEVEVRGKTGTLVLTVLSTDSVRLELDADDNGTPESTKSVEWDWLF